MDFGKVKDIDAVDFKLPPDDTDNLNVLEQGKKKLKGKPNIYIGCAKWGRKEWVGKLYPEGTKDKEYLKYYAKSFNSIELNAVHYRIPPDEWIERWCSFTDKNFKFCPKVYQSISHIQRLRNAEGITEVYLEKMEQFGSNLGTIFLQLPPNFSPKKFEDVAHYLKSWPKQFPLAVEFRHPGWFEDSVVRDETYQMLKEEGIGTVITDTAGRRDVCYMRLTTPVAFIRFVGNSLHPTDYSRTDDWVVRIKEWLDSGLNTLHFFMHHHNERYSPELSTYLIQELNKKCKLDIKEPEWIGEPEVPKA